MGRDLRTAIQKGYGTRHRSLRQRFARLVRSGQARCVRCGLPIAPNELWTSATTIWTARPGRPRASALQPGRRCRADEPGEPRRCGPARARRRARRRFWPFRRAPKVRRADRGFMSVRGPPPA